MLKIRKSKKQALSESAKNYLKNKGAKKVEESCGLKEDIDISRWEGKWDDGRYIIDRDKLVQALKYAAKDFIDNPKDGGCFTFPIDDRIGVVVGWESGYDADDSDGFIADNGWHVVAGLKCYTSDDMRTDYEWINFPYFPDGEVIDYWEEELPANLDDGPYRSIADYLIKGYEDELSKYEYAKNGEIIDSEIDEDDVDDAFIDDVELTSDDMNAGQWYESLKEVNPEDVEELNEDVEDIPNWFKSLYYEAKEKFPSSTQKDTSEQCKYIYDRTDMHDATLLKWRLAMQKEYYKDKESNGEDKFEGTPKEYVHADRDLFLKKLQQRGHRKPIVSTEKKSLTSVKDESCKVNEGQYASTREKYLDQLTNSIWNLIPRNPQDDKGEFDWIMEHILSDHDDMPEEKEDLKKILSKHTLKTIIHFAMLLENKFGYPFIWDDESERYGIKESKDDKRWCIDYVVGNTYKAKYIYAPTAKDAIKKANIKNIVDVNQCDENGKFIKESKGRGMIDVLGDIKDKNESCDLKERGLTRAERHNRSMDRIFDTYRKQNDALAKFLLDNGYSDEEVEELRKADKLNAEVHDKFGGAEGVGKALGIKNESCGKKKSRKRITEGEELDRKGFVSLIRLGDHPYDGYSVLNDGYFVRRIYAESDDEAIDKFNQFLARKSESCGKKK